MTQEWLEITAYLSQKKSTRIRVYRFSLGCSWLKRPSIMWRRIAGQMMPPMIRHSVEVSSSTAENPILTFSDTSNPVAPRRNVSQKRRPQIHHKFWSSHFSVDCYCLYLHFTRVYNRPTAMSVHKTQPYHYTQLGSIALRLNTSVQKNISCCLSREQSKPDCNKFTEHILQQWPLLWSEQAGCFDQSTKSILYQNYKRN
jgi:hypothetical protein